jgi:hypothetical protein
MIKSQIMKLVVTLFPILKRKLISSSNLIDLKLGFPRDGNIIFLIYNIFFCSVCFFQRHVPDFGCSGPSLPEFWLSRPVPSLGKIFSLYRCPFVPGQ